MKQELKFVVNGIEQHLNVEPRTSLADALRAELGLLGTHLGCEQGGCGACTVIVDDRDVRSCLQLAVQCQGADIETVDNRSAVVRNDMILLQEAFLKYRGFQCGFCTPGMIMTLLSCAREEKVWDDEGLRERLSGNICRCTGYESILDSARTFLKQKGLYVGDRNPEES